MTWMINEHVHATKRFENELDEQIFRYFRDKVKIKYLKIVVKKERLYHDEIVVSNRKRFKIRERLSLTDKFNSFANLE
jgi:hypothetical protein